MEKQYRVEKKQVYSNQIDYKTLKEIEETLKEIYNYGNNFIRFLKYYASESRKEESKLTEDDHNKFNLYNSYVEKYNESRLQNGTKPIQLLTTEKWMPSNFFMLWLTIYSELIFEKEKFAGITQPAGEAISLLFQNWKSFFGLLKTEGMTKVRPPNYLKEWSSIPINFPAKKVIEGRMSLPKIIGGSVRANPNRKYKKMQLLRVKDIYLVNLIYEIELETKPLTFEEKPPERVVGIDLGINKFATLCNNFGGEPLAINGTWLKSRNVFFNRKNLLIKPEAKYKEGAKLSAEDLKGIEDYERLNRYYNNKQKDFFNKASRAIVNYCKLMNVDTVVIGDPVAMHTFVEEGWISIKFGDFINNLKYKLYAEGIRFVVVDESYTTMVSAFDGESLEKDKEGNLIEDPQCQIIGKTLISLTGKEVDIDVNAAYNMIRLLLPEFKLWGGEHTQPKLIGLDKQLPDYLKTDRGQEKEEVEERTLISASIED